MLKSKLVAITLITSILLRINEVIIYFGILNFIALNQLHLKEITVPIIIIIMDFINNTS